MPFLKTLVQSRPKQEFANMLQFEASSGKLRWDRGNESPWPCCSCFQDGTHPHQHLFFFVWLMGKSVLCGTWKNCKFSPVLRKLTLKSFCNALSGCSGVLYLFEKVATVCQRFGGRLEMESIESPLKKLFCSQKTAPDDNAAHTFRPQIWCLGRSNKSIFILM